MPQPLHISSCNSRFTTRSALPYSTISLHKHCPIFDAMAVICLFCRSSPKAKHPSSSIQKAFWKFRFASVLWRTRSLGSMRSRGCRDEAQKSCSPKSDGKMQQFPDAAHAASWVEICPGNYESAGKRQKGTIRKGNRWAKAALVQAAHAARRTNSYLGE